MSSETGFMEKPGALLRLGSPETKDKHAVAVKYGGYSSDLTLLHAQCHPLDF